jgi:TetR/AcrR family transcriptional repressor of bet genes
MAERMAGNFPNTRPGRVGKARNVLKVARRSVPDLRREQLIEAAIKAIARNGIGETTIADVVAIAGMANGAVNQYFASKDALLLAALERVTAEFRATWQLAWARAGTNPAAKLEALVTAQFAPRVASRDRVAVWVAYWGEAKFRPKYLALCADSDARYFDAVATACRDLASASGERLDWRRVGRFLGAASAASGSTCCWERSLKGSDRLIQGPASSPVSGFI